MTTAQDIRNICIIAHVDHGKTTLVDFMLRQSGLIQRVDAGEARVMDSMDLERERGITIAAKNASFMLGATRVNIVDTPGHADFGGEVERALSMADGAVLLVDAAEGPLPQTRFVLQKALAAGLKVILFVNKVDRPECKDHRRIHEVVDQTFDLFVELGASAEQADFPILFGCGRQGWCEDSMDIVPDILAGETKADLRPLFQLITDFFPAPKTMEGQEFRMLVANIGWSDYVGQLAIGRVMSGTAARNQRVMLKGETPEGKPRQVAFNINRLYRYEGLSQTEVDTISVGDIGLISGCDQVEIGDTIVSDEAIAALPRITVERPTVGMVFSINTSPNSGRDGEAIQARKLRERLLREARNNVSLVFEETETSECFRLLGRGELQFGIIIEKMRRENLEFMVGRPTVLMRTDENGQKLEPMERLILDIPETVAGDVTDMFQRRKGILMRYEQSSLSTGGDKARVRLELEIPTRGLLGMHSRFMTATKGEGIMNFEYIGYAPWKGDIPQRTMGSLVCDREGKSVEHALFSLEDRGILFIGPGEAVYEGMIIGEANQDNDLNVNPCREKKLTNIRASNAEVLVTLAGIRKMPLERCLEWIDDDEWIEITPKSIRLRKKLLDKSRRSVRRADRFGL
jgi:GTP-binding protein